MMAVHTTIITTSKKFRDIGEEVGETVINNPEGCPSSSEFWIPCMEAMRSIMECYLKF